MDRMRQVFSRAASSQKDDDASKLLEASLDVVIFGLRGRLLRAHDGIESEISYNDARILHYVHRFGDRGSFGVAEAAHVSTSEGSRLVSLLVEMGLVKREPLDVKGKRRRGTPKAKLSLTELGKDALKRYDRAQRLVSAKIASEMLDALTPSERIAFARGMYSVAHKLGGL